MAEKDNLILQDPASDQAKKKEPDQTELGKSEQASQIEVDTHQTETDFAIQHV